MSVEAMALVLHHSRAKGTAKLVLLGIANHEGDGGSWPTIETLAKYANVDERNVQMAIAKLVNAGELASERQQGGTRKMRDTARPNLYRVLVRCPMMCDGSTAHRVRPYPQPAALPGMPRPVGVTDSSPTPDRGDESITPRGDESITQTVSNHPSESVPSSVTGPRARPKPASPEVRMAQLAAAREAMAKAKDTA